MYFAINCFVIQSLSLFSYFNPSLTAQGSDMPFSLVNIVSIMHEQNIIFSQTHLDITMHGQTIIFKQLFTGHMVGSQLIEQNNKIHSSHIQAAEDMENTPLGSQMWYCMNSTIGVFSTMYCALLDILV